MTPRLKTVSNLPLGFLEYRMINASNFRWGFPYASNPQRVRKRGNLFMLMMPKLKTVANLSLGSPEYDRTSARNFRWGFSLPATPKVLEKGRSFNGMMQWIKTVIDAYSVQRT